MELEGEKMRLVDADALIKNLRANKKTVKSGIGGMYTAGMLAGIDFAGVTVTNAPTVEARKHGRWVVTENTYQCQFCQYWDTRKKEQVNGRYVFSKLPNYCPDCGAVMDEEVKR